MHSRYVRKCAILTLPLLLAGRSAWAQTSTFSIHNIPLWIVYTGTVIMIVGAIWTGFWLGTSKRSFLASTMSLSSDTTISSVAGALMGLLAFILAFTFDQAVERFEQRRLLYVDQVSAIELAYRRADFLPERYRSIIQSELIKYVDLRINQINQSERIKEMVRQSELIHVTLQKTLDEIGRDGQIDGATLFATTNALMNLLTIHNRRATVITIYRLPTPLWVALYALILVSMVGMGHLFALAPRLNWTLAIVLSVSFSAVILLISDLDRSGAYRSIIHFDQRAMIHLKERLVGNEM